MDHKVTADLTNEKKCLTFAETWGDTYDDGFTVRLEFTTPTLKETNSIKHLGNFHLALIQARALLEEFIKNTEKVITTEVLGV